MIDAPSFPRRGAHYCHFIVAAGAIVRSRTVAGQVRRNSECRSAAYQSAVSRTGPCPWGFMLNKAFANSPRVATWRTQLNITSSLILPHWHHYMKTKRQWRNRKYITNCNVARGRVSYGTANKYRKYREIGIIEISEQTHIHADIQTHSSQYFAPLPVSVRVRLGLGSRWLIDQCNAGWWSFSGAPRGRSINSPWRHATHEHSSVCLSVSTRQHYPLSWNVPLQVKNSDLDRFLYTQELSSMERHRPSAWIKKFTQRIQGISHTMLNMCLYCLVHFHGTVSLHGDTYEKTIIQHIIKIWSGHNTLPGPIPSAKMINFSTYLTS